MEQYYQAYWGKWLKVSSVAVSLLMVGMMVAMSIIFVRVPPPEWVWGVLLLQPIILVAAALYTVRGYFVTGDELLVQRLFWKTRIPLQALVSAQVEPDAFRHCIRTCGNAGGFSISGRYYSKTLGHFRALATDLKQTVVLRFEKRVIVVSPSEPEAFVKAVRRGAGVVSA